MGIEGNEAADTVAQEETDIPVMPTDNYPAIRKPELLNDKKITMPTKNVIAFITATGKYQIKLNRLRF